MSNWFYFLADKKTRVPLPDKDFATFPAAFTEYDKMKERGEQVILCKTNNATVKIILGEE